MESWSCAPALSAAQDLALNNKTKALILNGKNANISIGQYDTSVG
jgi:hypothetical protein